MKSKLDSGLGNQHLIIYLHYIVYYIFSQTKRIVFIVHLLTMKLHLIKLKYLCPGKKWLKQMLLDIFLKQ